jgi:hypothetical protein
LGVHRQRCDSGVDDLAQQLPAKAWMHAKINAGAKGTLI